jgi:hypothetical protein
MEFKCISIQFRDYLATSAKRLVHKLLQTFLIWSIWRCFRGFSGHSYKIGLLLMRPIDDSTEESVPYLQEVTKKTCKIGDPRIKGNQSLELDRVFVSLGRVSGAADHYCNGVTLNNKPGDEGTIISILCPASQSYYSTLGGAFCHFSSLEYARS